MFILSNIFILWWWMYWPWPESNDMHTAVFLSCKWNKIEFSSWNQSETERESLKEEHSIWDHRVVTYCGCNMYWMCVTFLLIVHEQIKCWNSSGCGKASSLFYFIYLFCKFGTWFPKNCHCAMLWQCEDRTCVYLLLVFKNYTDVLSVL